MGPTRDEILATNPLAVRNLRLRDGPEERLSVALYGPFEMPNDEVGYFTVVEEPGRSAMLQTRGDSMFALSFGVEMCRLQLLHFVRRYGGRLVFEDGEEYGLIDIPLNPVRANQLLEQA